VAKPRRKNSATRPLQPADFPPPKRISREKVSEICAGLGISDRHEAKLKDYLDKLVSDLRDRMRAKAGNRRDDRDRIIKIRKRITTAQYELNGLGIYGRLAVPAAAEQLAAILSSDFLRYHFPGDAPPRSMRQPGVEVYSNYVFIRHRAPDILQALLRDLESVLASVLPPLDSLPGARGGRQPLTYRQSAILDLASFWHEIGKKVVGTPNSDFVGFCRYIFEVWGWRTDGLGRAIPNAITVFRYLQEFPVRLRK
jgi:hypothetical protein